MGTSKVLSARPVDLPEFDNPPVTEVVLSVQFSELRGYRTVHAGLLWERCFRESYPNFSEHPPLDPVFETFGPRDVGRPSVKLLQVPGPPLPRLWFLNNVGSELVQVQSDRFIHNWRKIGQGAEYPRYEAISVKFFDELKKIEDFFGQEKIGEVEVNQCEVTYVNYITLEDVDIRNMPERALRLLSAVSNDDSDPGAVVPSFEDARIFARYVMQGEDGSQIGRLTVTAQPALLENETPVLRLDLTARGAPTTPDSVSVSKFFDLGRQTIVRAFTALTTAEMHALWKRTK